MPSSEMLSRVALVRTDNSEERSATIIRVALIGELRLTLFLVHIIEDGIIHSHRCEHLKSYIVLAGWSLYARCNVSPVRYELGFYIPEDGILHSHCRENFKSYIALTGLTL
jgi:hypothetical protein